MSTEITLDTLANRNNQAAGSSESYYSVDVAMEPDANQVEQLANEIDLLNSEDIAQYGDTTYRELLAFGQKTLAHVRTNDFSHVNAKLADLANVVKNLNVEQMNEGNTAKVLSFLKRLGGGIKVFEKRFGQTLEQSSQAEAQLNELTHALREDKQFYDELLRSKQSLAYQLALDSEAAQTALAKTKDVTLPQLEAESEVSDNESAKQLVAEYRRRVNGFETQTNDLKSTQEVFDEFAPNIVAVQANNLQLADKLSQITGKILPYWKSQIALAISMVKEQELLKQKRENLKRAQKATGSDTVTHAEDLQLVDLDAVKKINNNLLSTISDAAMLQRAGQAARLNTEATLLRLDGRIRQAMISAAAFGDDLVPEPVISEKKPEPELETFDAVEEPTDDTAESLLLEDDVVAELEDQVREADPGKLPLTDTDGEWVNPESPDDEANLDVDGIDPRFGTYPSPPDGDFEHTFEGKPVEGAELAEKVARAQESINPEVPEQHGEQPEHSDAAQEPQEGEQEQEEPND